MTRLLCAGRDILDVTQAALEGGVTLLQYRDKRPIADSNTRQDMLSTAQALKALAGRYHIPLLINDHVELALEAGADGVHLGQGDMAPAQARALLGEQAIIGQTAYTQDHFKAIKTDPAQCIDYAGTGPFYETKTKKGKPLLGADNAAAFRALVEISSVPILGIGGITPDNAVPVIEAGAAGIAMMRAISEAPDPAKAACAFVNAVRTARAFVT
ncbi:MAG: thiamine phosphate synthase [Alphaproteobacteria bacterium]